MCLVGGQDPNSARSGCWGPFSKERLRSSGGGAAGRERGFRRPKSSGLQLRPSRGVSSAHRHSRASPPTSRERARGFGSRPNPALRRRSPCVSVPPRAGLCLMAGRLGGPPGRVRNAERAGSVTPTLGPGRVKFPVCGGRESLQSTPRDRVQPKRALSSSPALSELVGARAEQMGVP